MFIIDDVKGNQLIDIYYGGEDELISNLEYRPLTSSLIAEEKIQAIREQRKRVVV